MGLGIRNPQPNLVLHQSALAAVSDLNGEIRPECLHGLFAADTRCLSRYRITLDGAPWHLLSRARLGPATALWRFQNPLLGDAAPALLLSLRRRIDSGLHDELVVRNFGAKRLALRLALEVAADFADIFEVKRSAIPKRNVERSVRTDGLRFLYAKGEFSRALDVSAHDPASSLRIDDCGLVFELELDPQDEWRGQVQMKPEAPGCLFGDQGPSETRPGKELTIESDAFLALPVRRGQSDLRALQLQRREGKPLLAAGAPWFLTIFGRDTLMTSLMAGIDGNWMAEGALQALGAMQGTRRDDFRDEEPGKIPHELRCDELTLTGKLPYSPYYGTQDASSLYCLTLWNAWRWSGRKQLLEDYLEHALRAMRWCDEYGDRDGDGLQEYGTRSPMGYRHQGWKDAEDAVVYADGRAADPPLATVELQGYWYAARLALAELLEARGELDRAARERSSAEVLRARVEERYWMPERSFYAFALDADKQHVDAIASNPGHLLWCGLPSASRAAEIGRRLLQDDMHNGWGLRTLSSCNPAYNPLAYQLGSVWPHDTALAAAGLARYGMREQAAVLLHGILRAASCFEEDRLPELFAGVDDGWGFPVPYAHANEPQAWASAAPLLAVHIFLGLVPDAPNGVCHIAPWLPEWLPALCVKHIAIGAGEFSVRAVRRNGRTEVESLDARGIKVVTGDASAPLWGTPPGTAGARGNTEERNVSLVSHT